MTRRADRLLVTVTGPDVPGAMARLTELLAKGGAELADVEQVVVQGRLVLCFLVELPSSRDAVLNALIDEGARSGLRVETAPVSAVDGARPRNDWVVTLIAERIGASSLQSVLHRLHEHGAHVERIRRLTESDLSALELMFSLPADDGSHEALKTALLELSLSDGFDVAIQKDDVHRRSKRLVVMDMDSTLIRIEVIDELAKAAGVGEKVAGITARAMAGELDYDESLRQRVALLAGLDASHLDRIARNLPLTDGAETLIRALKVLGFRTAVLSGGFDLPAKALKDRLGLDEAHSNVLEVRDGKLTGKVSGRIVNARVKAELLEQIARDERIPLEQTVAIGDGANDLPMMAEAGVSIAYRAKPVVREKASYCFDCVGLDGLLRLFPA